MHDYTKYFKEQKGFERLIHKLYAKYQSLSRFSGTIKLEKINEEEAMVLTRFFGKNYKVDDTVTISIKKFIDIMNNSKYTDFNLEILISEYLSVSLVTKNEEKSKLIVQEEMFYQNIINESNNGIGTIWLKEVTDKKIVPYKLIHQRYNKNKASLRKELLNIIELINNLPKEKVLLPIYASNFTKDPHYLDLDTNHSNLFFYALSYVNKSDYPNTRETKI